VGNSLKDYKPQVRFVIFNGINDSRRNFDQIGNAIFNDQTLNVEATRNARDDIVSSVERTATAGVLATNQIGNQLSTAIDRNGVAGIMATKDTQNELSTAVERTGATAVNATERLNGAVLSEMHNIARDDRAYYFNQHTQVLQDVNKGAIANSEYTKQTQLLMKDAEIRNTDLARQTHLLGKDAELRALETAKQLTADIYKTAAETHKQAAEYHAISTRDHLTTRADVMKQALENTMMIQTEALKNKECLSRQMMECCCQLKEKMSYLDHDARRDWLLEARLRDRSLDRGYDRGYDRNNHYYGDTRNDSSEGRR